MQAGASMALADDTAANRYEPGRDRAGSIQSRRDPDDEAGAIAAAVQVFEDGLIRLHAGAAVVASHTHEDTADEATGLLAAIAGQTSLMALRAALAAARGDVRNRGFGVAAAEVKDLAGQMARATDTIVAQVGRIQAAAEQAQAARGTGSEPQEAPEA